MAPEIIFVIALLLFALVSFALEKLPTDVTSLTVMAILMLAAMLWGSERLPTVYDLIEVFSNPAPLTIACMFIISAALERCGVIEIMAAQLSRLAGLGYRRFLLVLIFVVAAMSAFVNNTAVVVVLLPVVLSLSRQMRIPASRMLIPLSYASIFGGICTTIGTSTNILMNGILIEHGLPGLSMFEIAWVGLPILFAATLYLVIFGTKLLPVRETLTSILSEEERKEYITEAFVKAGSELAGKAVKDTGLMRQRGVRLLEVIRNGIAVQGELKQIELRPSDRLVLACRPSGIMAARSLDGVAFLGDSGLDLEEISSHEGAIVEGVIGPLSTIVDRTIQEINFRQRYRMIILAVHRHGRNVRDKINTLRLQFGDTLLMMGSDDAIEQVRRSDDVILLDRPAVPAQDTRRKIPIVIAIMAGVILSVSLGFAEIVGATTVAVALLMLLGLIKPKDAYQAVEWRILVLIYGMLALGIAMETSGLTHEISGILANLAEILPPDIRPYAMLAIVFLVTSTLTETLSNNATVVLMAPIAIGLADTMGLDSRPFVMAACVASSASFATPIGYQTNTYVYGVGGYKFTDFLRVGVPLNLLYFVVGVAVIPQVWPFIPVE